MQFQYDITYFYIAIGLLILYLIYTGTRQPQFNPIQIAKRPIMVEDMTLQKLKLYDQKNNVILIALEGIIYDVSCSEYYRKGSAYSVFGGHDASVNLAKMSHEKCFLNTYGIITLVKQQKQVLDGWIQTFKQKYPVVGKVIKSP